MDAIAPRLILGWWLDGAPGPASEGLTVAVGPNGFLDLLVAWLGVPFRREPSAVRIATCQRVLRDAPQDAFWSASFSRDAWSTAQAVLELRDALFMAGWDGTADSRAPRRVSHIARIPSDLPGGQPEMLAAVLGALSSRNVELPKITLAEPASLWPAGWQRVFSALERRGTTFEQLCLPPLPDGEDLRSLRVAMFDGSPGAWRDDESICLLTSETEGEAADVLSAWLGDSSEDIALIKRNGGLLDPFLRARHQPRLGGDDGPGSGILPLALALRWDPFDAVAALEFLSLHRNPLGRAARFLANAIAESPGHGGMAFNAGVRLALRDRLRRLRESGAARADRRRPLEELLGEIKYWLPAERHARAEGFPVSEVMELCERLLAWSQRQQAHRTGATAVALSAAIAALRMDRVSPQLLGRMLDSVAEVGAEDPHAEAASWRHYENPGALISSAGTVVWWLADAPVAGPPPWRTAELRWMAARGLHPEGATERRGRERVALHRAVALARRRLVLVRPRAVGGEVVGAHPLLADLGVCFGKGLDRAWREAGAIRRGGAFAGRLLPAVPPTAAKPPRALRNWSVEAGAVTRRVVESPSGMEAMLGCELAWVLRYAGRLRSDGPAGLPDIDRLTGRFLHNVLRRLFESRPPMVNGAVERARDLFMRLLPQEAAPLLQPGQEAALARAATLLTHAVAEIGRRLTEAGLQVEAVEQVLRRPMPGGGTLEGRLDLLLRRPSDGLRLVLDAKWTRSNRRHRASLASDEAVQLAAYTWLAESFGTPVTAGYFLLRQGRLHTEDDSSIAGAGVAGADLPRTWDRALRTYEAGLANVRGGRVTAAGVPDLPDETGDDNDDALVLTPPCGWCDYRGLCGAALKGR